MAHLFLPKCSTSSVTRFGEISPLWQQKFKSLAILTSLFSLWQFLQVSLVFGKILNLLWQSLKAIGQFFIVVNSQILKNDLAIWSHWVLHSRSIGRLDRIRFCLESRYFNNFLLRSLP